MKVFSVINNKGGVGKTTTTLHLASMFANEGSNTILVDLAPQTNLSQGFMPKPKYKENHYKIEDFLKKKKGLWLYQREDNPNLKIIQGSKSFNSEEFNINDLVTSLELLNNVSKRKIDYVFIDCPPAVYYPNKKKVQIPEMALYSSDYVLIPIKADYYSYESIVTLVNTIRQIEMKWKKKIKIAGIFINQAKVKQVNYSIFKDLYENNPVISKLFLKSVIRENTAIDRACNMNLTIFEYSPNSIGADDFRELYKEVKTRIK